MPAPSQVLLLPLGSGSGWPQTVTAPKANSHRAGWVDSPLICMEMGGLEDIVHGLQCQLSNQIIKIKKQLDKPNFPAENTVLLIAVIFVNDF